jgi:uncharacterized protein
MEYEWDPNKAASNIKKHGITFREAATVFGDWLSVTFPDPEHSEKENRFLTIGLSAKNNILVISHTPRRERTRIISARKATRVEKKFYEENQI